MASVLLLPILLTTTPPEMDAEQTFRRMQRTVFEAKKLRLSFTSCSTYKGDVVMSSKGTFHLNENVWEFTQGGSVEAVEAGYSMRVVSDGKKLKVIGSAVGDSERDLPKYVTKFMKSMTAVGALSGGALWFSMDKGGDEQEADATTLFKASDFRFGEKTKIGGREAIVVLYKKGVGDDSSAATVWIDRATMLPVKFRAGSEDTTATEEYTYSFDEGKKKK
jgi:hypothetical protein